jgi:hypothetical protein
VGFGNREGLDLNAKYNLCLNGFIDKFPFEKPLILQGQIALGKKTMKLLVLCGGVVTLFGGVVEGLGQTVPLLVSLPGLGTDNFKGTWPISTEPCSKPSLLLLLQDSCQGKGLTLSASFAASHPDSYSWIPYVSSTGPSPASSLAASLAAACPSKEPSIEELSTLSSTATPSTENTIYTSALMTLEEALAQGYGKTHTLYVTCQTASGPLLSSTVRFF